MKWLVFLLAFVGGCVSMPFSQPSRSAMELKFDNEAMSEELKKYLSIDMPIDNAKRILEERGFEFFSWSRFWFADQGLHFHITYKQHLLIRDEINVSLYHEGGLLKSVNVTCESIGP